eukprot:scaffold1239_cov319-Prasinococcus_capsulatus_cf.AAC.6
MALFCLADTLLGLISVARNTGWSFPSCASAPVAPVTSPFTAVPATSSRVRSTVIVQEPRPLFCFLCSSTVYDFPSIYDGLSVAHAEQALSFWIRRRPYTPPPVPGGGALASFSRLRPCLPSLLRFLGGAHGALAIPRPDAELAPTHSRLRRQASQTASRHRAERPFEVARQTLTAAPVRAARARAAGYVGARPAGRLSWPLRRASTHPTHRPGGARRASCLLARSLAALAACCAAPRMRATDRASERPRQPARLRAGPCTKAAVSMRGSRAVLRVPGSARIGYWPSHQDGLVVTLNMNIYLSTRRERRPAPPLTHGQGARLRQRGRRRAWGRGQRPRGASTCPIRGYHGAVWRCV